MRVPPGIHPTERVERKGKTEAKMMEVKKKVVALAGGVGAARFLRGLVRAIEPSGLTVVVNTGDDVRLHGLHVSPDLDTITYTLGGEVHPEQGWGRAGDTRTVGKELAERYGEPSWFSLGDRDLATHLFRSRLLSEGASLSEATRRIALAWGLGFTLLPMTDASVETRIEVAGGDDLGFQEWWVRERAKPEVIGVRLAGAASATPAPGVLPAIAAADAVIVCPSNPIVSIGTILQVPGIREALRGAPVVGVSPIVGGKVVRGMADRLLPAMGSPVSAAGVAERYADFLDAWVMDSRDAEEVPAVQALGVRAATADTIMRSPEITETLARTALHLLRPT